MKKFITSVCVSLILLLGFTAPAAADQGAADANAEDYIAGDNRAKVISEQNQDSYYSTEEVLQLLLAGQGPMATEEMLDALGFAENLPNTDDGALDQLIDDYTESTSSIESKVTEPFQSGDPLKVDYALRNVSETFTEFVDSQFGADLNSNSTKNLVSAKGRVWMGANVAIYANAVGVANVVGYANAGVATLALATIGFFTWYLPDHENAAGSIDRGAQIEEISVALAKI